MVDTASNQRVTNVTLKLTLEKQEENMEKGFTEIAKGQEEEKRGRQKLMDSVNGMAIMYAECSAIQGQRWEAHEKVHSQHEKTHDNLRPKRDQNFVDAAIAAIALVAAGISAAIKNN